MNSKTIGFPDGNGIFGGDEFWKEYCQTSKIKFLDVSHNLNELQEISRLHFPLNICLASTYRLGRAVLLASQVDYLLFVLSNDKFVFNCPNSIYRIKWTKAYLKKKGIKTKVLTWPFDFAPEADLQTNVLLLTKILDGDNTGVLKFISNYGELPKKKLKYNFSFTPDKKNILLIGKIPFLLDPYRKTKLMDRLTDEFGIMMPHIVLDNDTSALEEKNYNVIFYKEDSLLLAIDRVLEAHKLHGVIFAADIFDMPGNYTFPIIKNYLDKINVRYFDIKITLNNYESKIEKIISSIKGLHKNDS